MLKLIFQTFPGSRTPFNLRRTHLLKETGKCFENEKKNKNKTKQKKQKKPNLPEELTNNSNINPVFYG